MNTFIILRVAPLRARLFASVLRTRARARPSGQLTRWAEHKCPCHWGAEALVEFILTEVHLAQSNVCTQCVTQLKSHFG